MANDTVPPNTSESNHPARLGLAPTAAPAPPSMTPTLRIKSLAPLLLRENVRAVLRVADVRTAVITVTFADGRTDRKTIAVAEGGGLGVIILDDNPDQTPPGAFCYPTDAGGGAGG